MKTVVGINLSWRPADDVSLWELTHGPADFRTVLETRLARLNNAISDETRRAIEWGPNPVFRNNDDPVYRQALDRLGRVFMHRILREIEEELDAILAVDLDAMLQHDQRNWLRRRDGGCRRMFAMASDQVCEYCGKNCHRVNGQVYSECPGSGSTVVTMYMTSGETPVEYGINLEISFVLE